MSEPSGDGPAPWLVIVRTADGRWRLLSGPWALVIDLTRKIDLDVRQMADLADGELLDVLRAAPSLGLGVAFPSDPPHE